MSETSRRKPVASTMPKEKSRSRSIVRIGRPAHGATFQMALRSVCNSPYKPAAPASAISKPRRVAHFDADGLLALWTIDSMASAAWGPTVPRSCSATRPLAAASPNNSPARKTVRMTIGAMANML